MSKTWKWILGVVLGLVILFGVGLVAANFFGFGHMSFRSGPAYFNHPMMDDYGFRERVPMDGFRDFRQPMMGGRGFYPFGGLFLLGGLLRLILPLTILVLVGYFSYQKGKKDGAIQALASPLEVETPRPEQES
jgi:hypothetical protein